MLPNWGYTQQKAATTLGHRHPYATPMILLLVETQNIAEPKLSTVTLAIPSASGTMVSQSSKGFLLKRPVPKHAGRVCQLTGTCGAALLEEEGTVPAQNKCLFTITVTTFPSAELNCLD